MPYCPNCGAENEADAAYCASCGAGLEAEASPPPPRPPTPGGPRWAILGGAAALVALIAGGVVLYNVMTGDGDGQERSSDGDEEERVVAEASPTARVTSEATTTSEVTPPPEATATVEPTAVPPVSSGHATAEEAIEDWLAPSEYAGDCSSATLDEDVGKVCSSLFGGSGSQLIYLVGLTFSEFAEWVLVEQQDDGTWLVADSAVVGDVMEPPWPVTSESSAIGYDLPAQAIKAYLEYYGLEYAGDCAHTDPETDVGSYCFNLWEDRGDQLIYVLGLAFSEPDFWLLLAFQEESGGWVALDVADFVPGPQDTVPPWP